MQSMQDREKFKQGLLEDLVAAENRLSNSQVARGGVDGNRGARNFRIKGMRYKGKLIAQRELEESQRAMDDVIEQYIQGAGFTDELEAQKHRVMMKRQLNDAQQKIVRAGGHVNQALGRAKADQMQEQATMSAYSSAIKGATALAVGGFTGGAGGFKGNPSVNAQYNIAPSAAAAAPGVSGPSLPDGGFSTR